MQTNFYNTETKTGQQWPNSYNYWWR